MEERFETFTALIASINHGIRKLKTEIMAEFDLKSTHLYCLYYLYKSGSLTAKELCDMCAEDKALISRSIKLLEQREYIVRTDTQKKYRTRLCLTDKGRKIAERVAEYTESYFGFASEDLTESDREVLYRSLKVINDRLLELCERYDEE